MINNFAPKERIAPSLSDASLPESLKEENAGSKEIKWEEPESSWDEIDYKWAFHVACVVRDEQKAELISRALLKSDHANDDIKQRMWEAYCEWTRLEFGMDGKLERLKELSSANPGVPGISRYLALALSHYDLHKESANAYLAAAGAETSSDNKIVFLSQSIVEHAREGRSESTIASDIMDLKQTALSNNCSEITLLQSLEIIYKEINAEDVALLIQHRLVELNPSDNSARFALAYGHSKKGNNALSLLHYTKITPSDRDGTIWNNLGVIYNILELKSLAVDAYRKAECKGETLARAIWPSNFLKRDFATKRGSSAMMLLQNLTTIRTY